MVYVNNGRVYDNQPLGLTKIFRLLDGFVMFFILFFKTLFGLDTSKSTQSTTSRGWGSNGGGGGGWGSGDSRPNGPSGGGRRPRFRTMGDLNQPTVSGGGCSGGSCGR